MTILKVKLEELTLRLNSSQSQQQHQQQQDAGALDEMKTNAEVTIQTLLNEIEGLKRNASGLQAAFAETETANHKQAFLAEANEKLT